MAAKDGTTRKAVISTTYVEDDSPEYEELEGSIQQFPQSNDSVDSMRVHFLENV